MVSPNSYGNILINNGPDGINNFKPAISVVRLKLFYYNFNLNCILNCSIFKNGYLISYNALLF